MRSALRPLYSLCETKNKTLTKQHIMIKITDLEKVYRTEEVETIALNKLRKASLWR